MSGRAMISCFSPPSTTPCSAPIPLWRRNHLLHATPPPSLHLLSRRSHLVAGGRRVWVNVKSEKNLSESPKYEDDVVVQKKKKRGLDNVEEEARWWQVFPKRWVIVVLCFSAFLLCNMDRVCNYVTMCNVCFFFDLSTALLLLSQFMLFCLFEREALEESTMFIQ